MSEPQTTAGRQLYALLPEVWRSRDNGDLAGLLDGFGDLLGLIRGTLEQRLADSFPDEPLAGAACQSWLLPYFAELVGEQIVSPDPSGQRAEVANAIAWRQVKGTLAGVERMAQEVGRFEVEVQEGWKRVAMTPRTGWPLPAISRENAPGDDPYAVDKPIGTVAFGLHSRALRTTPDDPAGRPTQFDGISWRQAHPHGTPCFPGSYEDPSVRTVDLRAPDWRRGHAHPRRLLLYFPPPAGYFPAGAPKVAWTDLQTALQQAPPEIETDGTVVKRVEVEDQELEERVLGDRRELLSAGAIIQIEGDVTLPGTGTFVCEGLAFLGTVTVPEGRLVLRRAAAKKIDAQKADLAAPVVDAVGSLIDELSAAAGLVRLEFVTVLTATAVRKVQASDSIFLGNLTLGALPLSVPRSCIRYSRVPVSAAKFASAAITQEIPLFVSAKFAEYGCGVLHPAAPASIRFGAEDGGEMGAYHDWRLALALEAVRVKLEDFLPLGLQAVLIPDPRLLVKPPVLVQS